MKLYGLFAKTEGDDLFPPTETLVSTSENLEALEKIKSDRQKAREDWFEKFSDQLPGYAFAGMVSNEVVRELPQLGGCNEKET